jgi:hypothetical protein
VTRDELERCRDWAIAKVTMGNEPPWSWYQHMKLREALDAILAGMDVTQPMEGSLQSGSHQGSGPQRAAEAERKDTVQRHPTHAVIRWPM